MPIRLVGTVAGAPFRVELSAGIHVLGRGADSRILLTDPSVSRRHAELRVEETTDGVVVRVRDLASRNGTLLGDRRITEETPVPVGSRLRFGEVELLLEGGTGTPSRPFTPTDTMAFAVSPDIRLSGDDLVRASRAHSLQELEAMPGGRDLSRTLLDALSETGSLLTVPRPEAELFDALLSVVERVVPARRIALLLNPESEADPEALPQLRATRPVQSEPGTLLVSSTILRTVLGQRAVLLVEDLQSDQRFRAQQSIVASDLQSALVAPLFDNEKVIGVLYADSNDPRVRFDQEILRAFALLANLLAVKITNARLLETRREKERMEQELATAARIQIDMLPRELPVIAGYTVAARLNPCYEAGGDLYDASRLPDGRVILAVGDVTGKGMGAALLMSHTLAAMRLLVEEGMPLDETALRLYRQVSRSASPGRFVTLFLGRLDPTGHRLEYANCGHNPPYVFSPDGAVRELPPTGLPLGMLPLEMMPPGILTSGATELAAGELLCVFSDGIPEATRDGEFYGEERLQQLIIPRLADALETVAEAVLTDVRAFYAGAPASDDLTLLLLRREIAAS